METEQNSSQPMSQVEEQQKSESEEVKKHSLSKILVLVVVGVVFLVIGGVAGYWVGKNQANQISNTEAINQTQETEIVSPTPAMPEKENFEVVEVDAETRKYVNTAYGFEFLFPNSWGYSATPYGTPDPNADIHHIFGMAPGVSDGEMPHGDWTILISVSEKSLEGTLSDDDFITSNTFSRETLKIGDYETEKITRDNNTVLYLFENTTKNITVVLPGYLPRIEEYKQTLYKPAFDQLMNSFGFTDLIIENTFSELKSDTYKNDKYKFQIENLENAMIATREVTGITPHQAIRIQNFTDEEISKNDGNLLPSQYFLEIFIYDYASGSPSYVHDCSKAVLNPQKMNLGDQITAYRGSHDNANNHTESLCIRNDAESAVIYILASERSESVTSQILDSFKFSN